MLLQDILLTGVMLVAVLVFPELDIVQVVRVALAAVLAVVLALAVTTPVPTVPASRRFRMVVLARPPPCYYVHMDVTMVTMLATVASIRLAANGSRSTLVTSRLARVMSNNRMTSRTTVPACLMARLGTVGLAVPRLVMLAAPVTTASSIKEVLWARDPG